MHGEHLCRMYFSSLRFGFVKRGCKMSQSKAEDKMRQAKAMREDGIACFKVHAIDEIYHR